MDFNEDLHSVKAISCSMVQISLCILKVNLKYVQNKMGETEQDAIIKRSLKQDLKKIKEKKWKADA